MLSLQIKQSHKTHLLNCGQQQRDCKIPEDNPRMRPRSSVCIWRSVNYYEVSSLMGHHYRMRSSPHPDCLHLSWCCGDDSEGLITWTLSRDPLLNRGLNEIILFIVWKLLGCVLREQRCQFRLISRQLSWCCLQIIMGPVNLHCGCRVDIRACLAPVGALTSSFHVHQRAKRESGAKH